jgi:hypothetical protein
VRAARSDPPPQFAPRQTIMVRWLAMVSGGGVLGLRAGRPAELLTTPARMSAPITANAATPSPTERPTRTFKIIHWVRLATVVAQRAFKAAGAPMALTVPCSSLSTPIRVVGIGQALSGVSGSWLYGSRISGKNEPLSGAPVSPLRWRPAMGCWQRSSLNGSSHNDSTASLHRLGVRWAA